MHLRYCVRAHKQSAARMEGWHPRPFLTGLTVWAASFPGLGSWTFLCEVDPSPSG
jgi:hypothetical protein